MSISVASGNSKAVENYSAAEVLPDFFESQAKNLIVLIKEYYKHLNSELNPSFEIQNLISAHDIDLASERYLDAIERVIAPNIPQSETLDRQRLFKIIANYYTNRGSEESVYTFFKIFYNEVVTLIYPKDFIFHTSNDKSVPSDQFKLRDSYKYQEFSYLISSNRDSAEWKSEFKKFVHPAGLKFFTALTVSAIGGDISLETMWNDGCGQLTKYLKGEEIPEDPCEFWESIDWEKAVGKHSPLYQPCIDIKLVYVFTVLYNSKFHYLEYLRNTINSKCSNYNLRAIYASYAIAILITDDPYGQVKRWDDTYRGIGKYLDHGAFGDGYSDYTIGGTELDFSPGRTVENDNAKFAGWSFDTSVDDFTRSYTCNIDPNETAIVDINSWIDFTNEVLDTGDRKKFVIGNGIDSTLSVVHDFDTLNIIPLLKNNITGELSVHGHAELTDSNTLIFNFSSAPSISEYSAYIFNVDEEEFSNGYAESFDGSETVETDIDGTLYWVKDINHNLSNDKLIFSVRDLATNEFISVNAIHVDNDTLRFTFSQEPEAAPNGYYITIFHKNESNDFSSLIGNGVDTEILIEHDIGTEDVTFSLKEVSTGDDVQYAFASIVDINTIKLEFNEIPSIDQYEIYVKQSSTTGIIQNFLSFKLGDGINNSLGITHNLNTVNVIPIIRNTITHELNVNVQWEIINANTVSFSFFDTPEENEYYVTIFRSVNNNTPVNNGFTTTFDGDDTIISGNDFVLIGDINNSADGDYGSVSYDYEIAKYEVKKSDIELWPDSPLPVPQNPPVELTFVTIGDEGNVADTTGYGDVSYEYDISEFAITEGNIADYNADPANSARLITIDSRGTDKPATGVTWNESARYVNWLNINDGAQPAYKFNDPSGSASFALWSSAEAWQTGGENLYRHKDAKYFLPSEDEWYKAAYYKSGGTNAGYWLYPTGSDTAPTAVASGTASDTAVYGGQSGPADVTQAGGLSPYGTMGQGGNTFEWNESAADGVNSQPTEGRTTRGGNWGQSSSSMESSFRLNSSTSGAISIRVARVEVPTPPIDPDSSALGLSSNQYSRYINWLNVRYGYQEAYNFTTSNDNDDIELWPLEDSWSASNRFRHKDAKYFMPDEDEWYKAAYYDPNKNGEGSGGYYEYPTGSDTPPTAVASGTDEDTAVFDQDPTNDTVASVYEAGGLSSYGTMGQGGNAYEFLESAFDLTSDDPTERRTIRGGAWGYDVTNLSKSTRYEAGPSNYYGENITLRLARNPSAIKINSGDATEPADAWTYNVNHNLNSENVIFAVSEILTTQNIIVSGRVVDTNNLELSFNERPELNPDLLKVSVFYHQDLDDYITTIGDGVNNEIDITHNLGTSEIIFSARDINTGDVVYVYGKSSDANTLKLIFEDIPTSGQYQIYIKNVQFIQNVLEYGSALVDLSPNDTFIADSDYINSLVYFEPGPASELICWYPTESNSN